MWLGLDMKKALIINLSGIGDVISGLYVSNPLIRQGYDVSFLIRNEFKTLFSDTKYNEYTNKNLPQNSFDLIVDLTSDKNSREIIKKLKSKNKIGRYKNLFNRIKYGFVYTKQVKKYPETDHIVYDFSPVLAHLDLSPDNSTYLDLEFPKISSGEVCIHVGAHTRKRCIPFELIVETCLFFKKRGIPVRLIGYERDIAARVLQLTENYPIYKLGTLQETKKWLNNAILVVAPDSGIFHLSSALNTKSIGLYGPNTYRRSGSINENATCLELDFSCRPCDQNEHCPYDIRCLNLITLDMLKARIAEMLPELVNS